MNVSNEERGDRFSVRLRRERERLGLTQQQFAELVGVSRMTQVNYESGKRFPGEDYFEALERIGDKVDRFFLFFGQRMDDMTDQAVAVTYLLTDLAEALEVERTAVLDVLEEITHAIGPAMDADGDEMQAVSQLGRNLVLSVLARSPVVLDEWILAQTLEAVDTSAAELGVAVDAQKRARITLMAYRQAKATGAVDRRLIASAIGLAG